MPKGKYKKYPTGGMINGRSHEEGGVPIEVEGNEFITRNDSVNEETLPVLEYINETGELPPTYAQGGRVPISNAMERVENYQLGGRVQPPTAPSIQPQAPAYKKGGKVK
tara:strand:+ start:200 stop:526 length:327 start_codon:yes stop_codon:yes gene_type:complete